MTMTEKILNVDVVLVDLDNTIYPFNDVGEYARGRLAEKISVLARTPASAVLTAYADIAAKTEKQLFGSGYEMRCERLAALAKQLGTKFDVEEMALFFGRQLADGAKAFPGAAATLKRLEELYQVVIMTEGYEDTQREILKRLSLDRFSLFATFTHAVRKSDGSAYPVVAEYLKVPSARMIMTGDNWQNDVIAAANSRLATLWISHGRSIPGVTPQRFVGAAASLGDALTLFGVRKNAADF
jgi:HAD superfamily hydrolase (TIGR01549 family)